MLYVLIYEFEKNLICNLLIRHENRYPLIDNVNLEDKEDKYICDLYSFAEKLLCCLEGNTKEKNLEQIYTNDLGNMFNILLDSIISEMLVHNNVFQDEELIVYFQELLENIGGFKESYEKKFILSQDGMIYGSIDLLEGSARIQDKLTLHARFKESERYIDKLCNDSIYENAEILFDKTIAPVSFDDFYEFKKFFILLLIDYAINFTSPLDITNKKFYEDYFIYPYNNILTINRYLRLVLAFKELLRNKEVEIYYLYNKKGQVKYSIKKLNEIICNLYEKLERITEYDNPIKIAKRILEDKVVNEANGEYLNLCLMNFKKVCEIRIQCPLFLISSELVNSYDRKLYLKYFDYLNVLYKVNGNYTNVNEETEIYIINGVIYDFLNDMFFGDNISLKKIAERNSVDVDSVLSILSHVFDKNKIDKIFKNKE